MAVSACPLCDKVLIADTDEALSEAHVEHLTLHLEEYFEAEVAAGRAERVIRDGKTLYRFNDKD